jgi:ditrans,polycis-polyprenyl diphosphate synthase
MTSAIKATIDEFSSPSRPSNPPFSQTRITQKIRSNHSKQAGSLDSISETSPDNGSVSDVDDSMSSTTALDPESPPLQSTTTKPLRLPNPENITADTINNHTYTADCPPLDIFIRTSNVTRLSDFMLWQCHEDTHIFFLKCFWPEFDLWHFLPVLLEWQWRQKKLMEKEAGSRKY